MHILDCSGIISYSLNIDLNNNLLNRLVWLYIDLLLIIYY